MEAVKGSEEMMLVLSNALQVKFSNDAITLLSAGGQLCQERKLPGSQNRGLSQPTDHQRQGLAQSLVPHCPKDNSVGVALFWLSRLFD